MLNSGKAALDLLESRSAIYSDRPFAWMFGELIGRKFSIFMTSFFDPRFKKYRRMLQSGLNPRAVQSYRHIQEEELRVLLKNLAEKPESFSKHVRRNAAAIILKASYGYQVSEDEDDYLVKLIEDGSALMHAVGRHQYLVDEYPILRFIPSWFPFADFKRVAEHARVSLQRVERDPFEWAKKQITSGSYTESFVSRYLRPDSGKIVDADEEDIIQWCSASLYVGGSETTVSTMTTFFLLMSLHPDIQKKAQAEIDQVVGRHRLPNLDDRSSLPYVNAVIKEILRYAPVAPLGLRHRVIEDDVYEGYLIPKGTIVIANIWAITHDSEVYPNPFEFDPNRHLGKNPQVDPFKFTFGFGRRICPGQHFAEQSLFLNIANILAMFSITKELDETGKELEPRVEWHTGATTHLKPFGCRLIHRFPESLGLLNI